MWPSQEMSLGILNEGGEWGVGGTLPSRVFLGQLQMI